MIIVLNGRIPLCSACEDICDLIAFFLPLLLSPPDKKIPL